MYDSRRAFPTFRPHRSGSATAQPVAGHAYQASEEQRHPLAAAAAAHDASTAVLVDASVLQQRAQDDDDAVRRLSDATRAQQRKRTDPFIRHAQSNFYAAARDDQAELRRACEARRKPRHYDAVPYAQLRKYVVPPATTKIDTGKHKSGSSSPPAAPPEQVAKEDTLRERRAKKKTVPREQKAGADAALTEAALLSLAAPEEAEASDDDGHRDDDGDLDVQSRRVSQLPANASDDDGDVDALAGSGFCSHYSTAFTEHDTPLDAMHDGDNDDDDDDDGDDAPRAVGSVEFVCSLENTNRKTRLFSADVVEPPSALVAADGGVSPIHFQDADGADADDADDAVAMELANASKTQSEASPLHQELNDFNAFANSQSADNLDLLGASADNLGASDDGAGGGALSQSRSTRRQRMVRIFSQPVPEDAELAAAHHGAPLSQTADGRLDAVSVGPLVRNASPTRQADFADVPEQAADCGDDSTTSGTPLPVDVTVAGFDAAEVDAGLGFDADELASMGSDDADAAAEDTGIAAEGEAEQPPSSSARTASPPPSSPRPEAGAPTQRRTTSAGRSNSLGPSSPRARCPSDLIAHLMVSALSDAQRHRETQNAAPAAGGARRKSTAVLPRLPPQAATLGYRRRSGGLSTAAAVVTDSQKPHTPRSNTVAAGSVVAHPIGQRKEWSARVIRPVAALGGATAEERQRRLYHAALKRPATSAAAKNNQVRGIAGRRGHGQAWPPGSPTVDDVRKSPPTF
jgi:hypothetical protein